MVEMGNGKSYRLIVSYYGFDEVKDTGIVKVARKQPAQMSYDPPERKRQVDFTFKSRKTATNVRTRLLAFAKVESGIYISKVIDDSF